MAGKEQLENLSIAWSRNEAIIKGRNSSMPLAMGHTARLGDGIHDVCESIADGNT